VRIEANRRAVLILSDGTCFDGEGIGHAGTASGEVVFHTSMTGYQEVFSDPSYRGQIVAMTCAHIGNVGVNARDEEAARPVLSGVVMREASRMPSNARAESDLSSWLERHGVVGITGVDVRALTRRIREAGAMPGVVSWPVQDGDLPSLKEAARACEPLSGRDLVREVTCSAPYHYEPPQDEWRRGPERSSGLAVVLDFGVKRSILECLWSAGYRVEVVPARTSAAEVLDRSPALVVLSNGPGDPEPVAYAVQTAKELLGRVPIFGICLGHQILGLALGARTFKLRFGHHGGNHPVQDLRTGRVRITAQNHGFAVDEATLPPDVVRTFRSLNDRTLEGFEIPDLAVRAVQFHPEAGPGPHDARDLFDGLPGAA